MKGFVGVTDNDWFAFLAQEPGTYEVKRRMGSGPPLALAASRGMGVAF